jgi:hypothetical protein
MSPKKQAKNGWGTPEAKENCMGGLSNRKIQPSVTKVEFVKGQGDA